MSQNEVTGRHLIFFHRGGLSAASKMARRTAGIDMPFRVEDAESATAPDLRIQDNPAFTDNAELTWGLQAIALTKTNLTGQGVRVAILDTGFDRAHPDFVNRGIQSKSFVAGVTTAQDDNGHGTHCLGTLAGPKAPSLGPRYGVAAEAQVFVAKVMDATGKGREGDILHGIGWALQNLHRAHLGRSSRRRPRRQFFQAQRQSEKPALLMGQFGGLLER